MINILSLNCSLAFAPYLVASSNAFLKGARISEVVRQGGSGMIIRSDDRLEIRHQNRECELSNREVQHYLATVGFRTQAFDVSRTSDEIVLASFGGNLLLSHPQSDLWLDRNALEQIVATANGAPDDRSERLPQWLQVSTAADRLLLSDQRNARWVLLAREHISELERRVESLANRPSKQRTAPPTIFLKGVTVRLQSTRRLAENLRQFVETREVAAYEEIGPRFSLKVSRSSGGIELSDGEASVGITSREAGKWADIIDADLEQMNYAEIERGKIKTVFADRENGRWILQWGDEVFVPAECFSNLDRPDVELIRDSNTYMTFGRLGEFSLALDEDDSSCVALTGAEAAIFTALEAPNQARNPMSSKR